MPPKVAVIRSYMTSLKNAQYHLKEGLTPHESVQKVLEEAAGVEYLNLDPMNQYTNELDVMGIIVTGILDELGPDTVLEIALDGTCKHRHGTFLAYC
jgi:hypothetical protein